MSSEDSITLNPTASRQLSQLEFDYDRASHWYDVALVESPENEESAWYDMGRITSQIIDILKAGL